MSVIGGVTFFMVKELIPGQMEESMLGHTRRGKDMVRELTLLFMGTSLRVNGRRGYQLVKVHSPGLMETIMQGNTKLVTLGTEL